MALFDIIPNIVKTTFPRYSEPAVWEEEVTRRTVSEDELPPAIREILARKSSECNFSETVDDNTSVHERKVSEAFVREEARRFNRPIKKR